MSAKLQEINRVLSEPIAQVDAALQKEPDKIVQLIEWLNQTPGMGWGLTSFAIIALAVAAIAKLTGNLDKILSFRSKYFGTTEIKLTEQTLSTLRQKLLKQMAANVALRLEDSLHNLIRIDLEQEEQRHQVGRRTDRLVEAMPKQTRPLANLINRGLSVFKNNKNIEPVAPAEKTHSIFYRPDIGRRLLILGDPGAGKTIELLTIAQRLVGVAMEDNNKPLPLIFELSSWTPNTPVLTWLGHQLQKSYGVSEKLAKPLAQQWIQQAQFLPLLDGLDELGQRNQIACINALEVFLEQHPALPIIVCCRKEEYERGGQKLKQMKGAIYLQSITPKKINQYLKELNRQQLWEGISASPELLALARVPLFLTMLVVAYRGQPIQDTATLFDAYIQKQLHDVSHQGTYKLKKGKTPRQTLRYLQWLAKHLEEKQKTEFLIEELQSDDLPSFTQKLIYELFVGMISGFTCGVILATIFSTAFGVIFGLSVWLIYSIFDSPTAALTGYLNSGITIGIMIGAIVGPGAGLMIGLASRSISPTERIRWQFRKGLRIGLRTGLISGLTVGLMGGLVGGTSTAVSYGIVATSITWLLTGLENSLSRDQIQEKTIPNQGIWKSIQNALLGGAIVGTVMGIAGALGGGLAFSLPSPIRSNLVLEEWSSLDAAIFGAMLCGIALSVSTGILFGLVFGLNAAGQHFALRIFLTTGGFVPWNYARFLKHTRKHRFTQSTGGRYRFIHDLLRNHFSQMTQQQQELLAQEKSTTDYA